MIIRSASFVGSSSSLSECPLTSEPEFGFIGRSNVGKSSLINLLTGNSRLAKISGNPGKTRTINHFLINGKWYLVDLPGYGYARIALKIREKWIRATEEYILKRMNLVCLFVLIDSRLDPQKSDLIFMELLGRNEIPFARIFTKTDKLSKVRLKSSVRKYDAEMLKIWESLPPTFFSSVVDKTGRDEILDFIEETLNKFSNPA
jgi:GTP-binding protein